MIRVSLTWVVEQLESINKLSVLSAESKGFQAWLAIVRAKACLREMFALSIYKPYFKVSFNRASTLFDALEKHVGQSGDLDDDLTLTEFDVFEINNCREQFETVFRAELATVPLFLITAKGAFDVERLIDVGIELFPDGLSAKVPEAEIDAMEAGKCLAFERSTSCGFHTIRVVEAVLRRYWDQVSSNSPRPDLQTLGRMAADLDSKKLGDSKVLESLKQLTKLHRNPISHPDVILSAEEARATIGMAHSVITHMLTVLPDLPKTTGASLELAGP